MTYRMGLVWRGPSFVVDIVGWLSHVALREIVLACIVAAVIACARVGKRFECVLYYHRVVQVDLCKSQGFFLSVCLARVGGVR